MAFKITIKRRRLKPNINKFNKVLFTKLAKLWEDAAKAFVERLMLASPIRVDTGMSKGSILPLARQVKLFSTFAASIIPKRKRKDKSLGLGDRIGRNAHKLSFGGPNRIRLVFSFQILIFQWFLHENFALKGGTGPWNALEKGRAAFLLHLERNKGRGFPRFDEWLDVSIESI